MSKLKHRIDSYQDITDIKLLNRLPVIICLNGRNFSKITQLLDKPYCSAFTECMLSTTLRLCNEVEGTLFGYQFNDEIILLTRNDQNDDTVPWFDNKIQKICSITSAVASLHFRDYAEKIQLNIVGDPIFSSQVFSVPTISEAINIFIYKQQQNFYTSVQLACLYNLLTKYDKNTIKDMLSGLNVDEKIDLLLQEKNIKYSDYPLAFKRGTAVYKIPKITEDNIITKYKWHPNIDLPIFTKDQSFLSNIIRMGADIYKKND